MKRGKGAMYTCYDCDRFGDGCDGVIPPQEYSNKIESYCDRFVTVGWRKEVTKDPGKSRLG
jgi:hypothetical protein